MTLRKLKLYEGSSGPELKGDSDGQVLTWIDADQAWSSAVASAGSYVLDFGANPQDVPAGSPWMRPHAVGGGASGPAWALGPLGVPGNLDPDFSWLSVVRTGRIVAWGGTLSAPYVEGALDLTIMKSTGGISPPVPVLLDSFSLVLGQTSFRRNVAIPVAFNDWLFMTANCADIADANTQGFLGFIELA